MSCGWLFKTCVYRPLCAVPDSPFSAAHFWPQLHSSKPSRPSACLHLACRKTLRRYQTPWQSKKASAAAQTGSSTCPFPPASSRRWQARLLRPLPAREWHTTLSCMAVSGGSADCQCQLASHRRGTVGSCSCSEAHLAEILYRGRCLAIPAGPYMHTFERQASTSCCLTAA